MEKLLSVIIPVYNGQKYIKDLLRIIQEISEDRVEFIFIDDGSKDSTYSILKEYENEKIIVFYKENGGVSSARNYGIENAKGKYITFIDSDDSISKDYVQRILKWLENDAQMICFDYDLESPSSKKLKNLGLKNEIIYIDRNDVFNYIINGKIINKLSNMVWNKIYKTSILRENNILFNTKKTIGEDLLFNLEYYLNIDEIICYEVSLYKYITRPNSIMTTYKNSLVEELFKYTEIFKCISEKYLISLECWQIKMFYIYRLYPVILGETKAPTMKEGLINLKKYLRHKDMECRVPLFYIKKMNHIQLISYLVFTLHLSTFIFTLFYIMKFIKR